LAARPYQNTVRKAGRERHAPAPRDAPQTLPKRTASVLGRACAHEWFARMDPAERTLPRRFQCSTERLKDSATLPRNRPECRPVQRIEARLQFTQAENRVEILLVVLHDHRDVVETSAVLLKRPAQIVKREEVGVSPSPQAIRYEDDRVGISEVLQARAPIVHLPGYRLDVVLQRPSAR
jgi:hypothetical protein